MLEVRSHANEARPLRDPARDRDRGGHERSPLQAPCRVERIPDRSWSHAGTESLRAAIETQQKTLFIEVVLAGLGVVGYVLLLLYSV